MPRTTRRKLTFDADRLLFDMAAKGWETKDLAAKAHVSVMAVSKFLTRKVQTVKMANRLAHALGYKPDRYLESLSAS